MIAQQGEAHAIIGVFVAKGVGENHTQVGGEKNVRLIGRPTAIPCRGSAKTVYLLVHVVPIHHAIGGHRRGTDKCDVVHPQRGSPAHGRAVNMKQHVVDTLQIGVRVCVQIEADVHPIGVAGGNADAAEIVLAVADGDAELQITERCRSWWLNPGQSGCRTENSCIAGHSAPE